MCNCRSISYCLGNATYIFERLASCCALTSVVTCIMTTLLVMLAVGVGLGYNYCFVDVQTGRNKEGLSKAIETHVSTRKPRLLRMMETDINTTTTSEPLEINATMIAPLNIGIDFLRLITDIRKKKINVTLELIV